MKPDPVYRSPVLHYITLYLGLGIGLMFFFGFHWVPKLQLEATIGLCIYYFVWGVIHHYLENDLHIKIILEYLLVAVIACCLLASLILRL